MEMKWTTEQSKVIELRDRNLLVSAAAGSGKTAVLVQRIIEKITDKSKPVDIDRILVVTFTKAAAAEMRERISNRIEELREINPDDENLIRQSTLINNAQITTIDSFCSFVVRNHFGEINLDPNFRIGEDGEIKLLEGDVLEECFDLNYSAIDNEAFTSLIDMYADNRSDSAVKDMIMQIYHTSQSNSWPKKWIKSLPDIYKAENEDALTNTDLFKGILIYVNSLIKDYLSSLYAYKDIILLPEGPEAYLSNIEDDIKQLEAISSLNDYSEYYNFFQNISFSKLKNQSLKDAAPEKEKNKNIVQAGRNQIKDAIKEIKNTYFSVPISDILEQVKKLEPIVSELSRLALCYTEMMEEKKRDKRIADFSDVEHFALKVFVDEETGERTATAKEFSRHFDEIMIDEYQDSNQIQEDILCAISGMEDGRYNMFMVGDVKQSIYRFRLARPELFMNKYNTYDSFDSKTQKIDLHQNFRSRAEVLDFSNDIFYKIMQPDLGGVAYDDEAALYLGADYPEVSDMQAELLIIDKNDEDIAEAIDDEDNNTASIEALAVAHKIQSLMKTMQVKDKNSGELRELRLSDIVILFRSRTNCSTFMQVLSDCGIAAYMESQSGYFDAYEVQIVLNMLRILDNPYQDIPMTAVLKSKIVGLDDEELAEIRVRDDKKQFSLLVIEAMEEATEGKLYEFKLLYNQLRGLITDTPIHELISILLEKSAFGQYVAAMPAGDRRALNLSTLLEKAISYEQTSYKGLYHFIRYIDALNKYEVDMGEAETLGENEDVVRLMTIHKSKGLEFPVVFVSGLGKKFNMRDSQGALVLHTDLGLGIEEISGNPKIRRKSIIKNEIANQITQESLGEELRVLYVALTRAKEKLILTGCINNAKESISKYTGNTRKGQPISFAQRAQKNGYLGWIIPAMLSYPDKYVLNFVSGMDMASKEAENMAKLTLDRSELENKISSANDKLIEEIKDGFNFNYEHLADTNKKSKYSVSEYKHAYMDVFDKKENSDSEKMFESEKEHFIPSFVEKAGVWQAGEYVSPGALRGTAVHRVMECLEFKKILELDLNDENCIDEYIQSQFDMMLDEKLISEDIKNLVPASMIKNFIKNPIAIRMAKADSKGLLINEKPFVMKYDNVLVQGIIDVFWFEDDQIVLLDYKTDNVSDKKELEKYKVQLELYADALAKAFSSSDKSVTISERLIYSFKFKEVISI